MATPISTLLRGLPLFPRYHYYNIFMPKQEANQQTNPMNFHPFSYQFYKCNPILTFSCIIENIDTKPKIVIDKNHYIQPDTERNDAIKSLPMPTSLLTEQEWNELFEKSKFNNLEIQMTGTKLTSENFVKLSKKEKAILLPYLNEKSRGVLSMRKIISVRQKTHYKR